MSGTMRGTPTPNRGPDRGRIPTFNNTSSPVPGSSIPRPVLDTQRESFATNSEVGGSSTVSASRQKQSKRDEVSPELPSVESCRVIPPFLALHDVLTHPLTTPRWSINDPAAPHPHNLLPSMTRAYILTRATPSSRLSVARWRTISPRRST